MFPMVQSPPLSRSDSGLQMPPALRWPLVRDTEQTSAWAKLSTAWGITDRQQQSRADLPRRCYSAWNNYKLCFLRVSDRLSWIGLGLFLCLFKPVRFRSIFLLNPCWYNVILCQMDASHLLPPRMADSRYKSGGLFTSRWASHPFIFNHA